MVIHVLHAGYAICGFSEKLPVDWPEGHKWVGFNDPGSFKNKDLCVRCLTEHQKILEKITKIL
ncbi:MAG: hypothetical protein AAB693_01670 [Patescibacteria group bacterium]